MGARRTREEWSDLVAEFEASGDSLERFCAKRRVRVATLKWWRWRLRAAERVSAQLPERGVRLLAVDIFGLRRRPQTDPVRGGTQIQVARSRPTFGGGIVIHAAAEGSSIAVGQLFLVLALVFARSSPRCWR